MFSCSSSNFSIWVKIFTYLDELSWVHYKSVDVRPSVARESELKLKKLQIGFRASNFWIKKVMKRNVMIFLTIYFAKYFSFPNNFIKESNLNLKSKINTNSTISHILTSLKIIGPGKSSMMKLRALHLFILRITICTSD